MKIQKITMLREHTSFTSGSKTEESTSKRSKRIADRTATVQDLYEMEERIIQHQNELFENQNRKLSDAFFWTDRLIWAYNNNIKLRGTDVTDAERKNTFHNAQQAAVNITK